MAPRVYVIGLDCLAPALLFDRYRDRCPTFAALMGAGVWGPLRSIEPPITVPAWSAMMSGYDAAQLGVYGFRHRVLGTYDQRYEALGDRITRPRVWDHLGAAGLTAGLIGVPDTYPPRPLRGFSVAGFLAPSTAAAYTWPDALKDEIEDLLGDYLLDVDEFRSPDKDRILADIRRMTQQRFALFRHLMRRRPCDFMMLCEIGPDRVHHAFWRFADPAHCLYQPGHPYERVIGDYYAELDEELARTLQRVEPDAHVFVVSDHGARPLEGGFCLNDWLRRAGYLHLREEPAGPTKFDERLVDFSRTRAWGWGGYYGRVFVNLAGREPDGQVPAAALESFLARLAAELEAVVGPDGRPLGTVTRRPRAANGAPPAGDYPDLMVYPGELAWRAVGTVGNPDVFVAGNDTGEDDANHDWDGVFIYRGPRVTRPGPRDGLRLIDVGPTILDLYGLPTPGDATGRPMAL